MTDDRRRKHVKLEPEVKAARAITRALEGLTPDERAKALHLSIGRREAAARLARYRMGLEAISLTAPNGYPEHRRIIERTMADA